jgi:predicted TIM-barrel fold metal-dependent hydrolase
VATPDNQNAPGIPFDEQPLDPARIVVDPHHHLWDHGKVPGIAVEPKPFLLQDFVRTVDISGHKVMQSVYVECRSMYRCEGPVELRPVGETEFANGMAAMSASGRYGATRVAAGIIANADLRLGGKVASILEAQIAAGNGRLRGIRDHTAYADDGLFGWPPDASKKAILVDATFREGVRALKRFGLSLDVWCVHTQLQELAALASACPDSTIVLNHAGTPLKIDAHQGRSAVVFPLWRSNLIDLARRPNVLVKISGLGMDVSVPFGTIGEQLNSTKLADRWRPYVETCLEVFGASRCMLASNFPVDSAVCTYGALWNAFKSITARYSENEKTALFSRTAIDTYRLKSN